MPNLFWKAAICGLAISAPVHAQRVEVMRFDHIVMASAPSNSPDGSSKVGTENAVVAEALDTAFQLYGAEAQHQAFMPGGPAVAAWPPAQYVSPCGPLPYHPRRDLSLRTEARRLRLYPVIAQVACEEGVPVGLFDALVAQESRYDVSALSPKGAIGLAQLMPGTARTLGVYRPWNVTDNLRGGARYLRSHLLEFKRVDLALAAYNAGPGRVRRLQRVPAIAETQGYVTAITRAWTMATARYATVGFTIPVAPIAAEGTMQIGAQILSY